MCAILNHSQHSLSEFEMKNFMEDLGLSPHVDPIEVTPKGKIAKGEFKGIPFFVYAYWEAWVNNSHGIYEREDTFGVRFTVEPDEHKTLHWKPLKNAKWVKIWHDIDKPYTLRYRIYKDWERWREEDHNDPFWKL